MENKTKGRIAKITKIGFSSGVFFLATLFVFELLEPGVIKAVTDDVLVSMSITAEITISTPDDVTLSSLPGMTGGSSTSDLLTWNVSTSNTGGYSLSIEKDHLLRKGTGANQTIADYTEVASGTPDYDWGAVGSGNEEFGFSPGSGADIITKYKNNGSACNQSGGSVTDQQCWSPIPNTPSTAQEISHSTSPTSESGNDTAIRVKAEVGSGNHVEEGTFTATITATALGN